MTDYVDKKTLPFVPQKLGNFPYYFSEEELEALVKWGTHATELTEGSIAPVSTKERQFIAVAKGYRPPETRFQRIWLRYLQAVSMEAKLAEVVRKASYNANLPYPAQPVLNATKVIKNQTESRVDQIGDEIVTSKSGSILGQVENSTQQSSVESPPANQRSSSHIKPTPRKAWEERVGRSHGYGSRADSYKDEFTPNGLFACTTCRGVGRYADGRWCLTCDGKGTVRR